MTIISSAEGIGYSPVGLKAFNLISPGLKVDGSIGVWSEFEDKAPEGDDESLTIPSGLPEIEGSPVCPKEDKSTELEV